MPYFKIELISDLCVSNGESFGSTIDTDISYDIYGIPVIKAKNLKGCLREISEELEDIKAVPTGFTDRLFGQPGEMLPSPLKIQNAHPSNYAELISDIQKNNLPQNLVRDCYTYTRGQTSVDKETGTAKKESLRNIRVLRRGKAFVCEYSVPDTDSKYFEKCIKALRYIGLNRTRGLGEIKCTPLKSDKQTTNLNKEQTEFKEKEYLEYTIHTLSPVIPSLNCKTDYIPAASVTGICFNKLGKEKMLDILDSGTIFTNAYVSDGNHQFSINPAFLAKQKEADYQESGMSVYVFDTDKCNQANPPALALKNTNMFISDDFSELMSMPVVKEINYHHKQSQSKPGTVDGNNFYQLQSFSSNQCFIGRIYGAPNTLETIANELSKASYHNIGYYRSSGYGQCEITIKNKSFETRPKQVTDTIVIWLKSPVILYDNYGMPCVKPQIFADYFNSLLEKTTGSSISKNSDGLYEIVESYLNYTSLGGYNSTWGMNKPVIKAYDSGSVFVFKLSEKIDISTLDALFVGERNSEGYGEITVFDYNTIISAATGDIHIKKAQKEKDEILNIAVNENPWELPSDIISHKKNCSNAVKTAMENMKELMAKYPLNPSTVGRLSLMLKENNTYDDFEKAVKEIKDEKKKEKILKWLSLDYNGNKIDEKFYLEYFNALFTHAKYELRRRENEYGTPEN